MKMNFLKWGTLSVLAAGMFLSSCDELNEDMKYDVTEEGGATQVNVYNTPKYIFYFIGDGMAAPQINLTEAALANENFQLKSTIGEMNIQKLPVTGMQYTTAEDRYITGSAASATALACGYKTTIGTIGMNGNHTESYQTMAEMAKEKGMKVGIISSVSIDHATPACFYAHTASRNNYYTIGQQLTESDFDYFAGGGVRWNKYSGEGQAKDINVFLNAAEANGYTYVNTRADFEALTAESGKTIATLEKFYTSTADGCAMPYVIDLDEQGENDNITLSEFTAKGIEVLQGDTNGFFLMVEGGKIDWACHANDAVSAAHNTVEFDNAIGKALEFYEAHPDSTLIIVTGDHECGGLTLGFAATGYETAFSKLEHQKASYVSFNATVRDMIANNVKSDSAIKKAEEVFGLGNEELGLGLSNYEYSRLKQAYLDSKTGETVLDKEVADVAYGYYDPFTVTVTHILNNKVGIDFTSYSHTGVPVPVFAKGQGQHVFNGMYENNEIANKIIDIAELEASDDDSEVKL